MTILMNYATENTTQWVYQNDFSWDSPEDAAWLLDRNARTDAEHDFTAACERTVAPGRCTGCEADADTLIPWSGERLCWPCTDTQLDLMAQAMTESVMVAA